jgi:hypothetical protein
VAVDVTHFKHVARERAILIVATQACFGIKPEAGGSVKRSSVVLAGLIVGVERAHEIRALSSQPFQCLFAEVFEDMIERWACDDQAARAATVA